MALVMLPCDLPWWPQLQRHLTQLALSRTTKDLIDGLQKIHNMCNIGLDPDEDDKPDLTVFCGLEEYLESLTQQERLHLQEKTIPTMVHHALQLKQLKPSGGFHFSLQQQADRVEFDRGFIASLLATGFFSTFPKRTSKTHPTLQNFNFSNFFRHLSSNSQKAKLRSIFHYFDILEESNKLQNKIVFSRQVMTSRSWLTIEDWMENTLPLCPLIIKHEGKLDRADPSLLQVCFSSTHVGGSVLHDGSSQECVQFSTHPELIVLLSFVEALEDNEAYLAEGVLQVARITDPHNRAIFETIKEPPTVAVTCMDPENYMKLPLSQFEEDNVLRELNKALLAFKQRHEITSPQPIIRRLSPIGESFSSTPPETELSPKLNKEELISNESPYAVQSSAFPCKDLLRPPSPKSRRGKFIVLGSSGECLPVSRAPLIFDNHRFSSIPSDSDSEEFHSARTSVEREEEADSEANARRYSSQLDTPERRSTFAERLRNALQNETYSSSSTESSYAVGISVAGSRVGDKDIKVRRGGSRGFVLNEDSLDDKFLKDSLQQEKEWIDKFRSKRAGVLARKDTSESSKYSFSTEFSSELEELYDQYSKWLEEVESPDSFRELDTRDIAVIKFAGSLLKRTLSESFAGISLTEMQGDVETNKTKLALVARSLSLELARHKNKLSAQVTNKTGPNSTSISGLLPVVTGNWGCGSTHVGEPQLKLVIQWLAASVAGVPSIQYYTCAHHKLLKLDTVCRVLLDRQWTVGELTSAVLGFAQSTLNNPQPVTSTLFDELIGTEKPSQLIPETCL